MGIQGDNKYQQLLTDVSAMYEEAVLFGDQRQSQQKVDSFWRMGQRIVQVVQEGSANAAYGKQVIRQLSDDLKQKYGKGMGVRTVRYIRSFALYYKDNQIQTGLSWSHYRALLCVENMAVRKSLEQRTLKEGLTKNELIALVSKHLRRNDVSSVSFGLIPREGKPGIYKVRQEVYNGKRRLLLDCGFGVQRNVAIGGVHGLADGEHLERTGFTPKTNTGRFARIDCKVGARYCYPATVLKVIDGDTVKMRMDLGFDSFIDESLRLRGVDAMELSSPEGKKSQQALARMLKKAKSVHVFTYHHDKHGRYIADIIVDEYLYINKQLVEQGHARFLKMD